METVDSYLEKMFKIGLHPKYWVNDFSERFFGTKGSCDSLEYLKENNFQIDAESDCIKIGYDEESLLKVEEIDIFDLLKNISEIGIQVCVMDGYFFVNNSNNSEDVFIKNFLEKYK